MHRLEIAVSLDACETFQTCKLTLLTSCAGSAVTKRKKAHTATCAYAFCFLILEKRLEFKHSKHSPGSKHLTVTTYRLHYDPNSLKLLEPVFEETRVEGSMSFLLPAPTLIFVTLQHEALQYGNAYYVEFAHI